MLGTQDMTNGGLNPDRPLSVLGRMLLVRRFEEKVLDLWAGGAFTGHFHVASSVCSSRRMTLPVLVLGRSATNWISRGTL